MKVWITPRRKERKEKYTSPRRRKGRKEKIKMDRILYIKMLASFAALRERFILSITAETLRTQRKDRGKENILILLYRNLSALGVFALGVYHRGDTKDAKER